MQALLKREYWTALGRGHARCAGAFQLVSKLLNGANINWKKQGKLMENTSYWTLRRSLQRRNLFFTSKCDPKRTFPRSLTCAHLFSQDLLHLMSFKRGTCVHSIHAWKEKWKTQTREPPHPCLASITTARTNARFLYFLHSTSNTDLFEAADV